jgi:hypothetical protein
MSSRRSRDKRINELEREISKLAKELNDLKVETELETQAQIYRRQERSNEIARRNQATKVYNFQSIEEVVPQLHDRVIILNHHKNLRGRTGHVSKVTPHTVTINLEGCGTPVTKYKTSVAIIDKYDQIVTANKVHFQ